MSPFSHRLPPPTIEPLAPLSPQSGHYQSTDDPPVASVFKRAQPPAPHSLVPVSMQAEAVLSTGPHMPIVEARRGPGLWTGLMIMIAGIAIGTLVGLTTRKTPNPADVLAQVQNNAPSLSALMPPAAPPQTALKDPPKDPSKDPAKEANASKDAKDAKDAAKEGKKHRFAPRDPSLAAAHASKAKEPKEPKEPAPKATKGQDSDDGYTVASADNGRSKPVLEGSGAGPKAAAKENKSEPKSESKSDAKDDSRAAAETKKPPKGNAGSGKAASDDAVNVLKAAMGATENTL